MGTGDFLRKRSRAGSTASKGSALSRDGGSRPGSSQGRARSAGGKTPTIMGSLMPFSGRRRSVPAVSTTSAELEPDSPRSAPLAAAAPPQLSRQAGCQVEVAPSVADFEDAASQSGISERCVSDRSESTPAPPPPRRWLAEVCVPLCEANYQIWKMQAAASDVCQRSGPAMPCSLNNSGVPAVPGQVNNTEADS